MKPGEKVVCIDDSRWSHEEGIVYPIAGEIYTVREITKRQLGVGLLLKEIINKPRRYKQGIGEKAFLIQRFRPVDYSIGDKVAVYITEQCEQVEKVNQN